MLLAPEFETAYRAFESWPANTIHKGTYHYALEATRSRLEQISPALFTKDPSNIDVRFRDLTGNDEDLKNARAQIRNESQLTQHLGDDSTIDPLTTTNVGYIASKKDPKCRFIFLNGGNSRSQLRITRSMFARIMTYHQVMPVYFDFVSVFGFQERPRDLRFGGFREQTRLDRPEHSSIMADLDRSGSLYQICFNLKAPEHVDGPSDGNWSIRQLAVYHQFDTITGASLWILTKGEFDPVKKRIEDMTGKKGRLEDRTLSSLADCFKSSISVHLLLCHWSTENWRWFIESLETEFEQETSDAKFAPRTHQHYSRLYSTDDLQDAQAFEDDVNEAIMVLEANITVLSTLKSYYERLVQHPHFLARHRGSHTWYKCFESVNEFASQLHDMISDTNMQVSRGKLLSKIVGDRKAMILQHLAAQNNEAMEALTRMTLDRTIQSQSDARAMVVVTVVTLLYLPATFVSTFFSTDVVKYQTQGDSSSGGVVSESMPPQGNFSKEALVRWLQVTLPLTAITLAIAWYIWWRASKNLISTWEPSPTLRYSRIRSLWGYFDRRFSFPSQTETRTCSVRKRDLGACTTDVV